ncbi:MAG: VCBS repeat-containing protein [Bryobacteraceae bacterium]|nr:VCBS repeat-containing protein [Bryobacteraceae bacterium]
MKAAGCVFLLAAVGVTAAPPARFEERVLATDLKGGYQVVALDMNRDGKPDLLALAQGLEELVWFENPGWQRHSLAKVGARPINLAACSRDADGYPKIVVAHGFANEAKNSAGIVSVVRRQGGEWTVTEIDRLTTSHRLRCAAVDGPGKKIVVNGPLTGPNAERPDYRGHVPLVYYRPGEWKRTLIGTENEGVMHGVEIYDWDGDGRDDILTASFSGIHVYGLGKNGQWKRTEIAKGDPGPCPKCGASDLAVGRAGTARFVASIEPWHGNQVVAYRQSGGAWTRTVIDDSLVDGHTIQTADLNGDGDDEIVAGQRAKDYKIYVYYAQPNGLWKRTALDDGGVSAAACAVADLNGDNRPDLACIGAATANLKIYFNVGP